MQQNHSIPFESNAIRKSTPTCFLDRSQKERSKADFGNPLGVFTEHIGRPCDSRAFRMLLFIPDFVVSGLSKDVDGLELRRRSRQGVVSAACRILPGRSSKSRLYK